MKDLIERLRNDTLDDISDTALEAADALERLTAGDIEMPAPCHHEMDGKICVGYFSEAQLKDYGDRRAAAAVIAERERCAMVCETTQWSSGIVWWKTATKSEISTRSAKECASAIRKGTL